MILLLADVEGAHHRIHRVWSPPLILDFTVANPVVRVSRRQLSDDRDSLGPLAERLERTQPDGR